MKKNRLPAIRYRILPGDPAAHLFHLTLTVERPDPQGQLFRLPAWIPGSYMIREFARNIVRIQAQSGGRKLPLKKLDKHSWQAPPCDGPLVLFYEVYAWDLSVRAAHLDETHGFFNGTSVFLQVCGQEAEPHEVEILPPPGEAYAAWRVATALPEAGARRYGFGTYRADDYDELIDHPVEMGSFALASFRAHGVAHDVVITGRVPNLDLPRLAADLRRVCEAQIALFEPETRRAPMKRYVFMTLAVGDGYGGLEHRASTALICSRNDLPVKGKKEMSEGYRTFLGLCSHEYFHTWNVKRIKPAEFAPYDLSVENYSTLLWLFEGFTSYYDDLMLVRSGLIDEDAYCKLLARTANNVMRGSGRFKQSVAESSFDAWTKYYRQDENSGNAIVSYYAKGSLVALGLDLSIRTATRGKRSLDDFMRTLWQRYGREFYSPEGGRGVTEAEVEALLDEIAGVSLKRYVERYIRGTEDVPLASLLAPFAIQLEDGSGKNARNGKAVKLALGARISKDGNECKFAAVHEGGAAHRAGLSAGDVLVAIDGLRVTAANLEGLLSRYRSGDSVTVHAFRRDELMTLALVLAPDDAPALSLSRLPGPAAAARLRSAWLTPNG